MRICVICEGCYPFVAGGVSSWLQNLMKDMPEHTFTIWAIGAQEKQKGHYAYALPANVEQVRDVFLDAVLREKPQTTRRSRRLSKAQRQAVRELLSCNAPDWTVIFELFRHNRQRNIEFLLNYDFLMLLEEVCAKDYPYIGFTDYFWTIRSMFLPLLYLLGDEPPEADLYYAVSAGYAGVLGSAASLRMGKPLILTEHGIYTREREEEILRTNWVPPHFKDLWINMFYMFTRCAYHHASMVTSLFHRASLIQQEIGCERSKCDVVPNGVRYERFCQVPLKEPDEFVDIGAVVRIVPIKDIKTMLYAFSMVVSSFPNARLHIMGPVDEDEEYYAECVQLKEDLCLENAIFTGRVDVLDYLRKIDFTVLTSISEGQPLAVLESMSAARPAVTTDVGCCQELIEGNDDPYGSAGLCVPVMHQSALAEAMLTLCEDEKLRKQMGHNGQKRVEAYYRQETMLEHYRSIFDRTVLEWRKAHGGYRV